MPCFFHFSFRETTKRHQSRFLYEKCNAPIFQYRSIQKKQKWFDIDTNISIRYQHYYRSAIADKLGSSSLNVSKDENLTRLLDSFHRDRPKGRRGIPSWNLSLVLHQLTKPPFEPLRKASLKHLTFKTVFS